MRAFALLALLFAFAVPVDGQTCASGRCAVAVAPAYYQVPAQHQYGGPVLIAPQSVTPSPQAATVVPTVQPAPVAQPLPVVVQPAPAVVTVAPPGYPQFPAPIAYPVASRRGFRPFGFIGRLFGRRQ